MGSHAGSLKTSKDWTACPEACLECCFPADYQSSTFAFVTREICMKVKKMSPREQALLLLAPNLWVF